MAEMLESSARSRTRNLTDEGHEAVAGSSWDRIRESDTPGPGSDTTASNNEVATEQLPKRKKKLKTKKERDKIYFYCECFKDKSTPQATPITEVVVESEPLVVEVKGHFEDPYMCIWDCDVGQLLQSDTFIFTHCRMFSKDDQHEWRTLHLYCTWSSDSVSASASYEHQAEPPGYQSFQKPMERVFQRFSYAIYPNIRKNGVASTNCLQLAREEFALSQWTFSKFAALREGFGTGMANGKGRVALQALLELLQSFIHINEKDHYLSVYNIGGGSVLGHGKVKFYVELDSFAKWIQTKKHEHSSSGYSSSSEYFWPVSLSGSAKSCGCNTHSTSPESEGDCGAANEDQEQVSSGIRRDLQKYFEPDVVLKANSIHTLEPLANLLTVSVKHGEIDLQAVTQLQCEILPLVLKHNIAVGLVMNAYEAYIIKLFKINGKITRCEDKYCFIVFRNFESDFLLPYFNCEQFNSMCVHIINACQKVYDAYLN